MEDISSAICGSGGFFETLLGVLDGTVLQGGVHFEIASQARSECWVDDPEAAIHVSHRMAPGDLGELSLVGELRLAFAPPAQRASRGSLSLAHQFQPHELLLYRQSSRHREGLSRN